MPNGYHHLTDADRCQIHAVKANGYSLRAIAREMNRNPATISRELRRNSGERGYRHKQAEQKARERRRAAASRPWKLTAELWSLIEGLLVLAWSPEPIAGRLRRDEVVSVSAEWIYQYIRADRQRGGVLWRSLRRRGKKPNVPAGRDCGRGCLPNRVDISERPEGVAAKSRVGDWEVDTVIGKGHRGVLVTLVDRMSKLVSIPKVRRKTAVAVGEAISTRLAPYPVHTVTADNGKEFARHETRARTLSASFCFARPYASWERGLNEHTNGLIRGYFPKGTDFHAVTAAAVQRVPEAFNPRPRQVLGYRTPQEVMAAARA